MRILLIKTSSMGDIIHTLPALTDAGLAIPHIQFDWVIEPAFQEIPKWHPLVKRVIPVALRKWRKGIWSRETRVAWQAWREQVGDQSYDLILDAQGLIKSAFLAFFTKGKRAGLDWHSARESLASLAYHRKCKVDFYQHAIVRKRELFRQALGYALPATDPDFGLDRSALTQTAPTQKYLVFLHATTWASKLWPQPYWLALARLAAAAGYRIKMGGGNPAEVARAEQVAAECSAVDLVPYLSIEAMATLLVNAAGAVAVDTGFGHLAAALNVPTLSLYGSTNPQYTGALGQQSIHLSADFPCAPCLRRECQYQPATQVMPACYENLSPLIVWERVKHMLNNSDQRSG